MPRQMVSCWDDIRNKGNPTKSILVNKLFLKVVETKETRGHGKKSNANRPFEREEFEAAVDMIHRATGNTPLENWLFLLVLLFQCHFIGRIDDAFKSKKEWFKAHPEGEWGPDFFARLPWSKNVQDKRDSPYQLVLGGDYWKLCVLLHFAIYFEVASRRTFFKW